MKTFNFLSAPMDNKNFLSQESSILADFKNITNLIPLLCYVNQ